MYALLGDGLLAAVNMQDRIGFFLNMIWAMNEAGSGCCLCLQVRRVPSGVSTHLKCRVCALLKVCFTLVLQPMLVDRS